MTTFAQFPRISPFLWFDANAEEAVEFYLSIFPNSRRLSELRNPGDARGPKGAILTLAFELDGVQFTALNGGPHHKFTDAISLAIRCETQQEVDHYWSRLTADGGEEIQCGWLRDKFGLSWQVTSARLPALIRNHGAFKAMLGMKKIDIAELERAARD